MLMILYFLIVILGAAFGSFFNVCISRIPKKESIVFPASHCPNCNYKIKSYENVPILSYLLLKGKCKNCHEKINIHYFLVELITPIIFVGLFAKFGLTLIFLKYLIFFSFGIIIFSIDLFHKIIPNKLSLPLIPLGLLFSFCSHNDISWKESLLGFAFGFGVFLIVAYIFQIVKKKESLGGGDIKLIAGIGAFTGIIGSIFTIIIGSTLALVILLSMGHKRDEYFAFGPFLLLGSAAYIILGDWFLRFYLNLIYL